MMPMIHALQTHPFTDERNQILNQWLTHTRGDVRGVHVGTGSVVLPAALVPAFLFEVM